MVHSMLRMFAFAVVAATLLAACTPAPEREDFSPRPVDACPLPMEYAIRSVCPFSTAEIDGECRVVCYDFQHDPNPDISASHTAHCEQDSECSCDFFPSPEVERCGCVNEMCAAIINPAS